MNPQNWVSQYNELGGPVKTERKKQNWVYQSPAGPPEAPPLIHNVGRTQATLRPHLVAY